MEMVLESEKGIRPCRSWGHCNGLVNRLQLGANPAGEVKSVG
jgi:hypothetical protein